MDMMQRETQAAAPISRTHAAYALGLLTLMYAVSTMDRFILSILSPQIKLDFGISDAQLGFLNGTAFAVFYSVFGIPLGKLADTWVRRRLIAVCMALWSLMTLASGFTRNFAQLSLVRIGVAVGESAATPSSYSMLPDLFGKDRLATVIAVYNCGAHIGMGLGIIVGGLVLQWWGALFTPETAPLGLKGWQAALLIAALPGLVLAFFVNRLREPQRGGRDGLPADNSARPQREFLRELGAVLPVLSTLLLLRETPVGERAGAARRALLLAIGVVATAALLIAATGDVAQWLVLGLGVYAAGSWVQHTARRDPVCAQLIFRTRSLRSALLGYGLLTIFSISFSVWAPSYFVRFHGAENPHIAHALGLMFIIFGSSGMLLGGVLGDKWRQRSPRGYLYLSMLCIVLAVPLLAGALFSAGAVAALAFAAGNILISTFYLSAGPATVQRLVLPRMRATTSAIYMLMLAGFGSGLGPYSVGLLSDRVTGGDIRFAILSVCLAAAALGIGLLWNASRSIEQDEATLLQRARLAGEV